VADVGATRHADGVQPFLMRAASPARRLVPWSEQHDDDVALRPCACITRQCPASLMKPVFDRPMCQSSIRVRR